jgi:RNA polymerase sigma factor (sigma-70 family)
MARGLDVETLYRTYGHSVLRRARQILANDDDANDIVQEIFASLIARPGQYDRRSAPSTFLYAVTTHACLARLRDRRNRLRLLDEQVRPWVTDVDRQSPEARSAVQAVLARLPDDEASAAIYYHLDGMSHAEVAEVMDCSPRHVANLLARIVTKLGAKEAS